MNCSLKELQLLSSKVSNDFRSSCIRRFLIVSLIFSLIGFVIMIKIFEISREKNFTKGSNKILIDTPLERGLIKDRNGKILASNIFKYNLKAYPKNIQNIDLTLKKLLVKLPNINEDNLRRKLKNKNKYEVIIKKNFTAPIAKEINSMGIPGLEFYPVIRRFYPHKNLTAHLVGHVNESNSGVYGSEKSFDELLSEGETVNLALDLRLQYAVREELLKSYNKLGAKSATAIILDLNTSEILTLVSLPDFNPNQSINPKIKSYRNSATLNLYEMGSTFKIFTIAAALEKTIINLNSLFDARKPLKIANYYIKDYHPENKILNTKEVFIKSSNIGASLIGLELGADYLKKFYKKIGILNFSSIDLLEKSKPIVPKKWGEIETATLSFGHGISITPMHMMEAAALLFSKQKFEKLNIKKQTQTINNIYNDILSPNTRNSLLELMTENVFKGTARKANIEGYEIGGKTATGEKTIKGKYKKDKLVSSFLSIFPSRDPKYIALILFDEPNYRFNNNNNINQITGGTTAAPVTAKILERILPILGVAKKTNTDVQIIVKNKEELDFASY